MRSLSRFVVCASLAVSGQAFGQAKIVPTDGIKTAEATDVEGWAPFLSLNSTISLTSNANVVGQVDGFSTLFGLGITGGAAESVRAARLERLFAARAATSLA